MSNLLFCTCQPKDQPNLPGSLRFQAANDPEYRYHATVVHASKPLKHSETLRAATQDELHLAADNGNARTPRDLRLIPSDGAGVDLVRV
jgi:hypothetical protein